MFISSRIKLSVISDLIKTYNIEKDIAYAEALQKRQV